MKTRVQEITLLFTESGKAQIVLTTNENRLQVQKEVAELKQIIGKGKELSVELKQYRKQRSLNANSYFWVICNEIANVLRADKDDIYIQMLTKYGQREPNLVSIVADAVDIVFRATKNHCCVVGESELNGKTFKHLAILKGSSQYETREMSILIDGVVSEAKEMGIETLTPNDLARIKSEWGSEKEAS